MVERKKIIYVVTEDWYFWLHRLALGRAALAAGFQVTVAARVQAHEALLRAEGFDVVALPWRRRGGSFLHEFRTCFILWRLFRQEKPDIVHAIALKAIVYAGLIARLAGVKTRVLTVAGLGYVFTATRLKAQIMRPLILVALRFAFTGSQSWVTLENPDDAVALIDRHALRRRNIATICCCGVDIRRFSPAQPIKTGTVIAGMACRLVRDKGAGLAAIAVRQLRRDGLPVKFRLAGGVDSGSSDSHTAEEIAGWLSGGSVEWLGHIDEVAGFWRGCDIAIYPSTYGEGVPRSLLEAAACGLPIITTDLPGCRQTVRDGVTGFLVPPNDPAALADKLRILIENPGLRQQMGEAARRRAVAEFADEVVTARILAVYGAPEGEVAMPLSEGVAGAA